MTRVVARAALAGVAALATALLPAGVAEACPPPPLGYIQPTEFERLQRFVAGTSDIVYGQVVASPDGRPRFKVYHVYRGSERAGTTLQWAPDWDFPVPVCAGMMTAPGPKPVGTYGVVAFRTDSAGLVLMRPDDVQTMIAQRWIRSARAR